MNRIPELDGLRGWAVLLVLWGHFPFIEGATQIKHVSMIVGSGHFGVNVFFALSGFLITRILIREKREGRFSMARFYLKRTLRIFPIYYLTLLIVMLFITTKHAGWLALYTGNFVFAFDLSPHPLRHTWSLAVEEHFYLIWPLLLGSMSLAASKKVVRYVLPAFAIVCALLTYAFVPQPLAEHLIYRGTMYQILPLCLGAAIAFDEEKARRLPAGALYLMLLVIPTMVVLAGRVSELLMGTTVIASAFTQQLVLYGVASTCTLLVVLNVDRLGVLRAPMRFAVRNPVIRSIGTVSYGLYLYHFVILYALGLLADQAVITPLQALGLIALQFAVAYVSWYLIEAPILRWKDRLTGPRTTAPGLDQERPDLDLAKKFTT